MSYPLQLKKLKKTYLFLEIETNEIENKLNLPAGRAEIFGALKYMLKKIKKSFNIICY